ncbi:MAG: DUF2378 family protein [Myxococcaceae bacterium]|nr:DUF2378 family protein [Myxococcaceae bacterium]
MPDQLEFARSIEGTFLKGLGPDLTPEVKDKLRAAGLDLDRTLLPAYPAEEFHRWVRLAAAEVFPDVPEEEACRHIGFRTIAGLEDTVIGRALAAGLKLMGPKRSLQRLDRIFRNNNNYQQATLTELGERSVRVGLSNVFELPSFYQGVFEAAMKVTGAKQPRVTVVDATPPGVVFQVEWD